MTDNKIINSEIDYSINGKTRVFGLIGDPVEHTFSPQIQNTFANYNGFNFKYVPFHVNSENLGDAIKGAFCLNIEGLNVTVPHKQNVIKFLSSIDKKASEIGAVNTLKITSDGYSGYNTDIIGILYSLMERNIYIKNKKILIIGAGGSARAAAILAASENAECIFIANRTIENAKKLAQNVKKFYNIKVNVISLDEIYNLDSCDIIIQTTTLGFGKNLNISPIIDIDFYKKARVSAVFDTIYTPWETKFISDAKKQDIIAINGFDMLIYQAVAAQEIWFDITYSEEIKKKLKLKLTEFYKNQK